LTPFIIFAKEEAGPQRVKIGPIKWAKLNVSFDTFFFSMEDRAYMMVYGYDKNF
jgi:hypothetical protein